MSMPGENTSARTSHRLRTGCYACLMEPSGTASTNFSCMSIQMTCRQCQQALSEVIRKLVKEFSVEYRLQRADGATIWVSSRASAYSQPDGRITAFGTTSDITELKQMETSQRESKEFLDKIINSISDPIFVIDRQHRHVLVNDAMCETVKSPLRRVHREDAL